MKHETRITPDPFNHDSAAEPLSPRGVARRDAILRDLERAQRRRARSRTAARVSVAALPLLAAAGALWLFTSSSTTPTHTPSTASAPTDAPGSAAPRDRSHETVEPAPAEQPVDERPRITIVRNDPGIVDRLAAQPQDPPVRVELLDDAALLEALAEAGLDYGLIRTQGRVFIVANSPTANDRAGDPLRPGW